MNLNIKGQNGHSPFHYTKTGTKQSFNSKEVPSFCIKKQKQTSQQIIKPQTNIAFKPEFHQQAKRASLNTSNPTIVPKVTQITSNIQFKDIKDPKDGKQKQKQERRNSIPKRVQRPNQENKIFNRTQSPKYFGNSHQQPAHTGFNNTYSSPFKQNQSRAKNVSSTQTSQVKVFLDVPKTPVKQQTMTCQSESAIATKSSQNPQTHQKKQPSQTKTQIQVQFVNKTHVMTKLAFDLNQKQQKVSQLQKKLVASHNQIIDLKAHHTRQLNTQQRQKEQLLKQKQQLQFVMKQISTQNKQLKRTLQSQKQQLITLKQSQAIIQLKLSDLQDANQKLQDSMSKMNEIKQVLVSQDIINQVQKQLQEKGERIIELEKYNESILIELERVKESIMQPVTSPIYSLPEQGNFNIFQQAFKTYISETQKYKQTIKQRQKEIDGIKQKYNVLRIQNQRLKNQLRIEQLRRETDLRHNNTISSIQRESIMNQLKDTKRQLTLSKQKARALNSQIKSKDQFIMKNIKAPK